MSKRKVSTTDEWVNAAIDHIKKIDEDERYEFVHSLIFNLALYGGYNDYEIIGIMEAIKQDLIESIRRMSECDGDCDNRDNHDGE